jgi:hypothetical protein
LEVKETFAELLSSIHVRMPQLIEALAKILAKRLSGGASAAALAPQDSDSVARLLTRIFNVDDPIYKKVTLAGRPLAAAPNLAEAHCRLKWLQ